MGFDASKLDFIIVYYYNLAGGINLYYTTVTQEGVQTKCPIIKVSPDHSLKEETKFIKFSVSTENVKNIPIKVKIEGKDAVANEGYYTINNVKKVIYIMLQLLL